RTSVPAMAGPSTAGWSAAGRASTPGGSGFVWSGRTMARTLQPRARNAPARCHPRNPVAPVRLTERLFIEPVRFVAAPAGRFDAGVDGVVVLERPRHLASHVA